MALILQFLSACISLCAMHHASSPAYPFFAASKLRWNLLAQDSIKLGFQGRWSIIGFQGKVGAEIELLGQIPGVPSDTTTLQH